MGIQAHFHVPGYYEISIRLDDTSVAGRLDTIQAMLDHLEQGQAKIMSALDILTTAVDGAVTEMAHAAQTITNHPNPVVSEDPQLAALAERLNNAAAALKAVDPADTTATGPANPGAEDPAAPSA